MLIAQQLKANVPRHEFPPQVGIVRQIKSNVPGDRIESYMRRHFLAFFVISLLAELGTTLLQRQRTTTDVYPGLYYPNFNTMLAERLLFWFVISVLLSGVWCLISRRARLKET